MVLQSVFESDPDLALNTFYGTGGHEGTQTGRKQVIKAKKRKSERRKSWERWILISLATIAIILTIALPVIHFLG